MTDIKEFMAKGKSEESAPLMAGVPNILIATPWSHYQVSSAYAASMINMALNMPFPANFALYQARHTADARNAICMDAIEQGYTHIMMVDADQRVDNDTFNRLWTILEGHGHEDTIATGWATIKGGIYKGKTSILVERGGDDVEAIAKDDLPKEPFQAYSMGAAGMLFSTAVLTKIPPPWFADVLVVDDALDIVKTKEDGEEIIYWPLERRETHDYTFGIRMSEAGVKIMVDPNCQLPHEVLEAI